MRLRRPDNEIVPWHFVIQYYGMLLDMTDPSSDLNARPTAAGWTVMDWLLLAVLGLQLFLQGVFIPARGSFGMDPRGYALAGLFLATAGCVVVSAMLLWALIQYARKRKPLSALFRVFVLVALSQGWLFVMAPSLWEKFNSLGAAHFDTLAEDNETAALDILVALHAAQSAFQKQAALDADADGAGEFGGLKDLESSKLLPAALKAVAGEATYTDGAYIYIVFLPEDANARETKWCAYAWPRSFGQSGIYSFFVHETGDLYARKAVSYNGPRAQDGPAVYDAYFPGFTESQPPDPAAMAASAFADAVASRHWSKIEMQ